jgi:hypothetical protein
MHNFMSTKEKELGMDKEVESLASPTELLPPYAPPRYEAKSSQPSNITSSVPDLIPNPAQLLTIQARGSSGCCWGSGGDSTMLIFNGTNTSAEPLYISTRISHKGNDSVLSRPNEGDILSTAYRWGYGSSREPKMRYLNGGDFKSHSADDGAVLPLKVNSSSWSTSVELTSTTNPNQSFKWTYLRTKTLDDGKRRVLALFAENASSSSKAEDSEPLAVLVRSASTRSVGSSRWDAGNGGHLLISPNAAAQMDEALILASCIMMLKKERDRQRNTRNAAFAAAVSS